jgi:hypothetical protein
MFKLTTEDFIRAFGPQVFDVPDMPKEWHDATNDELTKHMTEAIKKEIKENVAGK